MIVVEITNVVAKAAISGWSKDTILGKIADAQYRPNGFPAICIMQKKATVSLFDSGKITSMGSKSIQGALESINDFCKRLKSFGMKIRIDAKPTVSMITSKVSLGRKINISSLRGMPEFKKDVDRFSCIQIVFDDADVMAYESYLKISAKNEQNIISTAKKIDAYDATASAAVATVGDQ